MTLARTTAARSTPQSNESQLDAEVEVLAWAFHPNREDWQAHGFATWEDAEPWIQAGVTPVNAAAFNGFADPEDTAIWVAAGVSRADAAGYVDRGFTVHDAVAWHPSVGPREASAWAQLGFDPLACAAWRRYGFDGATAAVWCDEGFMPVEANMWRNHYAAMHHSRTVQSTRLDVIVAWAVDQRAHHRRQP